jgi:hypothetical protein
VFISPVQGLDTNAARNEVANCWVSTNGRQDRQACFVKRRGDLRLWGMLGVPMPMTDHSRDAKSNHLRFVPDWPYANDLRWVDNYGRFDRLHSRYGGEYFGITPVFHLARGGTVSIDGGFACFGFPDCRQCIVFLEETPARMVFRDFGWAWRLPSQRSVKRADEKSPPPNGYRQNFLYEEKSFQPLP